MKYKITDLMDLYEDADCPLTPLDQNMQKKKKGKEIFEVNQSKHAFDWKQGISLVAAAAAVVVLCAGGILLMKNKLSDPNSPNEANPSAACTVPVTAEATATDPNETAQQFETIPAVETTTAEEPSLLGEMVHDEGDADNTHYSYVIPCIQADTAGAKAINDAIDEHFGQSYREIKAAFEQGDYSVDTHKMDYYSTSWNGILSVVVHQTIPYDSHDYVVYNYEISTGRWLSTVELLERMDIDEDDFVRACQDSFQELDVRVTHGEPGEPDREFALFTEDLLLQDGDYYRESAKPSFVNNRKIYAYPEANGQLTIISDICTGAGSGASTRVISLALHNGKAYTAEQPDSQELAILEAEAHLPDDYFSKFTVNNQDYFSDTHIRIWEKNGSVYKKDLASGQTGTLNIFDSDSDIETTLLGVTADRLYYGWRDDRDFAPGAYFVYSVDYFNQDRIDYHNQDLEEYGNGLQVVEFWNGRMILKSWTPDDRPIALCVIGRNDQVILQSKESHGGVEIESNYYFICAAEPLQEEAFLSQSDDLLKQTKYEVYRMNPDGDYESIGTLEGYLCYGLTSDGLIYCDNGPYDDAGFACLDLYTLEPVDPTSVE